VDILRTRGRGISSYADLFVKKSWIFQNLWCVHTDKGERGLSQFGQGEEGSIFRDFVQAFFMDGPLNLLSTVTPFMNNLFKFFMPSYDILIEPGRSSRSPEFNLSRNEGSQFSMHRWFQRQLLDIALLFGERWLGMHCNGNS